MKFKNIVKTLAATLTLTAATMSVSHAALINGTGLLENGVNIGSGIQNGSFSGINENGIELGLRGKLRFDLNGAPQSVYNYDGDRTYTFDAADGNPPGNLAMWNFEFSIDISSIVNANFDNVGYQFFLGVDNDPSANVNFVGGIDGFEPLFFGGPSVGTSSILQGSQNIGFGFGTANSYTTLDPQLAGTYTISLLAVGANDTLSTSIDIVVNPAQVSAPAGLSLFAGMLLAIAWVRRKTL